MRLLAVLQALTLGGIVCPTGWVIPPEVRLRLPERERNKMLNSGRVMGA